MEEKYLTVSALTKYIKYKFDHDHNLDEVLLTGEISNFKHNSRGHFYFTLKDEGACISATMFASSASRVKFEPEDGMKVFVKGNVTVYEPSGSYQINVKELKSDGIGDLFLAFEKLKKDLEQKGYFDPAHKIPIPRIPKTVGVITSPTGAAIRDIINTISRRYPLCNVILYPAIVQGDAAKNNISSQIKLANEQNLCDVLIVGRGGGSYEDLWAFNELVVADAIYESHIPIISAVGHEVDFTIADFVASIRAATPTAAAEIATPSLDMLKSSITYNLNQMSKSITNYINNYKVRLSNLDRIIDSKNPLNNLKYKRDSINNLLHRLNIAINQKLNDSNNRFNMSRQKLEMLNPLAIMDKGYSITRVNDKVITKVEDIKENDLLVTILKNGSVKSKVIEVGKNGK